MSRFSSRNVWYPRYQDTDLLQLCKKPLEGVKIIWGQDHIICLPYGWYSNWAKGNTQAALLCYFELFIIRNFVQIWRVCSLSLRIMMPWSKFTKMWFILKMETFTITIYLKYEAVFMRLWDKWGCAVFGLCWEMLMIDSWWQIFSRHSKICGVNIHIWWEFSPHSIFNTTLHHTTIPRSG